MSNIHPKPTDAELEVLQILWNHGPSTVKTVHELISKHKQVGYTTTLKTMQIMADKGICSRILNGKTHTYNAVLTAGLIQTGIVENIIKNVFNGSAMNLVLQTLGNHQSTESELRELKKFIAQMEQNKLD